MATLQLLDSAGKKTRLDLRSQQGYKAVMVRLNVHSMALAAVLAMSGRAYADEPAFTIGPVPKWFLLGGVTSGGTVTTERGGYVGGELSFLRLNNGNYVGVYSDAYYDFGIDGTYVTGGLELGHRFVGVDGGLAKRFVDGVHDTGFTGRVVLSVGVLALYVRYAHFDALMNDNVVQVGGMLKLPLARPFGGH
jgi:hypothetical protein